MNIAQQKFGVWCGLFYVGIFSVGMWAFMGFFPPLSPTLTPAQVAAIYQQNTVPIRIGCIFIMISGAVYAPFSGLLTTQMLRIKNSDSSLAWGQLTLGGANIVLTMAPGLFWAIAAFRPDRDPNLTVLINDFGWCFVIMPYAAASITNLLLGMAILVDKNTTPVFPRWSGYYNLWCGLMYTPGGVAMCFKSGPFAWNGLIAFDLAVGTFFVWFVVMFPLLMRAIKQQETEIIGAQFGSLKATGAAE
jgi:hypothetical protein